MNNLYIIKNRYEQDIYYLMNFAKSLVNKNDILIINSSSTNWFENLKHKVYDNFEIDNIYELPIYKIIKNINILHISSNNIFNLKYDKLKEKFSNIILFLDDFNDIDNIFLNSEYTQIIIFNKIDSSKNKLEDELLNAINLKSKLLVINYSFDFENTNLMKYYFQLKRMFPSIIYEFNLNYSSKFFNKTPYYINNDIFDKEIIIFFKKIKQNND